MAILDALCDYNLRAFPNLGSPVLTAEVIGESGSTTYSYKATIETINGETTPSEVSSVTDGPAALSANTYVSLSLVSVPEASRTIKFFRSVAGTYYYIGESTPAVNSLHDTGLTPTSEVPPTADTSGRNQWVYLGIHPDRLAQRMEMIDLQGILSKALRDLGNINNRDGDAITGLSASQSIGGTITASIMGPYNVAGKYIKLGFLGQTSYTIALSGAAATAAEIATQIEAVINVDLEQIDCSSVNSGYLKLLALGGRYLVVYAVDDDAYTVLGIPAAVYPPLVWDYTAGKMYLEGLVIEIPAGQVTLTGAGTEKVGVLVSTEIVDYTDDPILRNIDENIPEIAYNLPGADRIIISPVWAVDEDGMVVIQEFENGAPKKTLLTPKRSELDIALAQRTYDVSGSFCVNNFPLKIADHPSDDTKLQVIIGIGSAYPNGFLVKNDIDRIGTFDKARVVKAVNNSSIGTFSEPGGYTITTNAQNYNVNGLNVKFTIGSGNAHTVALTGSGQTAAEVKAQIEASINAYPTDDDLIECTVTTDNKLKIQAVDGKNLTIGAVATDAYTILGLTPGIYTPIGTRLYETNNPYVKTVTDMSYVVEVVESRTHNGVTLQDLLSHESVIDIKGAAATAADAHDGKWDATYGIEGEDFERVGDYISFVGMSGHEPGSGATYYVKYTYRRNAVKGTRELVRVVDAQITKGAAYGKDSITVTGATSITRLSDDTLVQGLSGTVTDVVTVLRVNATPGQGSTYYTEYDFIKNSATYPELEFGVSQIDWAGAGAPGSSAIGQPVENATYYVSYEFWYHPTEGDYVSSDSYDTYESIELAPNDLWYLRDCIDFRTLAGVRPIPDDDPVFDFDYYLPRTDKLVLEDTGVFFIIKGEASARAPIPKDQPSMLSLAVLRVPPYTYRKEDVQIVSVEPVRKTQAGIQNLEDRIARLEYWGAVNALEKEAAGHTAAVDSKGMFTDALTGWGRQDVAFDKNGITHTMALDRHARCLMLPFDPDHSGDKIIFIDPELSDGVIIDDDGLILDYDPVLFDSQIKASRWMNCSSDYEITNYYGTMLISPTSDTFMDSEQLPDNNVDFDNNFTDALNTLSGEVFNKLNWSSWDSKGPTISGNTWDTMMGVSPAQYGGGSLGGAHYQIDTVDDRTKVNVSVLPGAKTMQLGNRVVDLTLCPMVRTKNEDNSPFEIKLSITGLLPNQDHACTIAGIPVNLTYDSVPANKAGLAGTHTLNGKTTACTSNDGMLTAKFEMPLGVKVGTIPIVVFYYADASISVATTVFCSRGFMQVNQGTTIGYEAPQIKVDSTRKVTKHLSVTDSSSNWYNAGSTYGYSY